ncbi:MAG: TIGR00730 family Rossman fold protein [Candidatus Methylacidiphilales bacterium]|nr:TIGR00730 family Rossman fold protein [Candidatus Methylacidiphilales bacterium]
MKRLCVYCGSSMGSRAEYREAAESFGSLLAREKIGLVYGGGNVGLMGVVADAVMAGGGEVIGVIPQALVDKEVAHFQVTRLHVVDTMHERKAMMAGLADGFVALPGGYGTLEELFEILTWSQLGFHPKPVGLLNTHGYYDPLLGFLHRMVEEGFLREDHRTFLAVADEGEALLCVLRRSVPAGVAKW